MRKLLLTFENLSDGYVPALHEAETLERAEKATLELTQGVNSNENAVALGVARALAKSHRTLQQSTIGAVLEGITAYLEWAQNEDRFDARNEAAVNMNADLRKVNVDLCKVNADLRKVLDDHPLPFI